MKMHFKAAAGTAAILMALAGGQARADSSYGATDTATNAVSATASVRINVTTPKLILLRVGNPNTQTVLDFNLQASIAAGPSPIVVMNNNQSANWDAVAPTFALATPVGAVAAYLWHNNSGDASLTCSATTPFTTLVATDVLVASSGAAGFDLNHPGVDTACADTITGLSRNTVHTGSWTYSLKPSLLTTATPGSDTEVVTYTATTL